MQCEPEMHMESVAWKEAWVLAPQWNHSFSLYELVTYDVQGIVLVAEQKLAWLRSHRLLRKVNIIHIIRQKIMNLALL